MVMLSSLKNFAPLNRFHVVLPVEFSFVGKNIVFSVLVSNVHFLQRILGRWVTAKMV